MRSVYRWDIANWIMGSVCGQSNGGILLIGCCGCLDYR